MTSPVKDLYEFLVDAELQQYYNTFRADLKVTRIGQLRYVDDSDLVEMGLSKPEIRRLRKFYRRECPQGALGKIKRILSARGSELGERPTSPATGSNSPASGRAPSKHIISHEDIVICKTLGTGEFGTVQQGVWTNDDGDRIQVAIKCLSKEKLHTGMADFLKEATIMHAIDHEHIVRLYGVVLHNEALMLVTELAQLRSLLECLKEPSLRPSFPVPVLCNFAQQIAEGMAYLENKRLIHRDLAARNILVFAKDKVKVSDFGLSRALGVGKDYYQTNFNVNLKLPIAWCAPESINYLKFTSASDVWAYGVTLWEMFSYGFQPWAAFTGEQILDAIDEPNHHRLEQPERCPRDFYQMMLRCWEHDPKNRPTFTEIIRNIAQVKPELLKATKDCDHTDNAEYLLYLTGDIVTVLDKKPAGVDDSGVWRGVMDSGKTGLFVATDMAPHIELKVDSPLRASRLKISRKESARKSLKSGKKFRAEMISRPQNDLRHTGHIGYDGAMFGDVSFIGDQYDKLPVKVVNPYQPELDRAASSTSSLFTADSSDLDHTRSELSLTCSTITAFSTRSNEDTLTDVSSYRSGDMDGAKMNGRSSPGGHYTDIADGDDLDSFKLPDMSLGLDLGSSSFLDEIMSALDTKKDANGHDAGRSSGSATPVNETAPLIPDRSSTNGMTTSFENAALSPDYTTGEEDEVDGAVYTEHVHASPWSPEAESPWSPGDESTSEPRGDSIPRSDDELIDSPRDKSKFGNIFKMEELCLDEEKLTRPSTKKQATVKPMSASDEKQLDEAIAIATELAEMRSLGIVSERSRALSEESDSSSKKTVFGLLRKSPKEEKKTFTQELLEKPDLNEDVSPEQQEAYNLLVVKGTVRERGSRDASPSDESRERQKQARERRMRRALEHQKQDPSETPPVKERPVNMNIRKPIIPGRSASTDGGDVSVDTNPLRRLRDSQHFARPSAVPPRPPSGGGLGLGGPDPPPETGVGKINGVTSPTSGGSGLKSPLDVANPKPLPPRVPLKPSTINLKPRERKHPLEISEPIPVLKDSNLRSQPLLQQQPQQQQQTDPVNRLGTPPKTFAKSHSQSSTGSDQLNTTRDSEDSVFTSSSEPDAQFVRMGSGRRQVGPPAPSPVPSEVSRRFPGVFTAESQFSVKMVDTSAEQMGLKNDDDDFWTRKVNFEAHVAPLADEENFDEIAPMQGRYKTSDAVSYEDLMEFALDASSEQSCEEIRVMKKVLSQDITVEDCFVALDETGWELHQAIKFLKLKQLLALRLSDLPRCKAALLRCDWRVEAAAADLLSAAAGTGRASPDCVDV